MRSRRWWQWTIRHELALLVLATLLPFAVLGVFWAFDDYRAEQARSQTRALRLAREVSAEVDQFVDDAGALVEALARVPSVKRVEQPQADQLLEELAERYSYYESLFVAAADGRTLAAGGEDVPPPGNRLAYIREVLDSSGTVVTNPIAPRNSARHVFVVATPLWDETGKPLGIVAVSVNLFRLQEGLRRAELPEHSSLLVVDRQGRIVARRSDPERWVGRSALDSSAVRSALRLREGVSEGDFVDGVRRLSGFAPAQRVPWEVIVGIPTDEAYGALRRALLRSLARLTAVAVAAGLVAWALSRRLTRPMSRLAAGARAYAGGELGHRIAAGGPVEVAALGATLNAMAAALQQQLDELQATREREREANARALAELRRLHSEFIAVAAHELRTPVAAAKSYAELLCRDDADLSDGMRRQALLRLDAVCERLARLVRSLLGASRIQAGRLVVQCQPLDVAALAAQTTQDFRAYTPGHHLQFVGPGEPGKGGEPRPSGEPRAAAEEGLPAVALGDAERVEDVLMNLLANAAKYAPAGTTIQVRVRSHAERVEVQVADQGPGIPEAEQAAVFERFRRGSGVAAGGVGLGLYIAQAYVQAMGGDIGVHSAPGRGATFWFCLPRMGTAAAHGGRDLAPARDGDAAAEGSVNGRGAALGQPPQAPPPGGPGALPAAPFASDGPESPAGEAFPR